MGSSRFPGKPMKKINGTPMIEIVYRNCLKCKLTSKVVVATCDKIIFKHIQKIGGEAVMTSPKHSRASDRCAEALKKIENKNKFFFDIVMMVQGDEPMINSKMLNQALMPMIKNKNINVINLVAKINDRKEFNDRNCIKVVQDKFKNAIYFSREPIPTVYKSSHNYMKKQVCVIPFRRNFLIKYLKMNETELEKIESLDMMRILENGYKVKLVSTKYNSHAVDTPRDLKLVSKILK